MSLTWRDSLSVRRCASIAVAIIEKVQYTQSTPCITTRMTRELTNEFISLISFHSSTLPSSLNFSLSSSFSLCPPLSLLSLSPPSLSLSFSFWYRLHLKKTCTSNYWSKFYWLVYTVCHSFCICVSKSVL